jgi:hypothetical protein
MISGYHLSAINDVMIDYAKDIQAYGRNLARIHVLFYRIKNQFDFGVTWEVRKYVDSCLKKIYLEI